MRSGRRPGFKHSKETVEKIRQSRVGQKHSAETKEKLRISATSVKSAAHRERLSLALTPTRDQLVKYRFSELLHTYPQCSDFLESRREELLCVLQDIKSDKELNYITTHIENLDISQVNIWKSGFSSSSVYAYEDTVIELLDKFNYLKKLH